MLNGWTNFLQRKVQMESRTYATQASEEELTKLKQNLSKRGLAQPLKSEKKQRAIMYLLLNDNADEKMTFGQF